MVLSLFKFHAIANTYVGNFRGNCTIQLNGQAIVILNNGMEINRWPYNCIRQFRAEDESGKFSFVSGRRGPYGVAEYNFQMHGDSLMDLQGALTEFTGAQFSAVAPGSDPEQQPLQPQEPLPPRHPSGNSYVTSLPRRTTVGSRTDSMSSDMIIDSVFPSPARSQPPKLPPRPSDYTQMEHPTSRLSISADETTLRSTLRGRASTSASSISGTSLDSSYSVPRPALPPRHPAKEPSPEALVAISTSYEETKLNQYPGMPEKSEKTVSAPSLPTKKKSFFNRHHKTDDSKSSKKSSKSDKGSSEALPESHSPPHSSHKKGKTVKRDDTKSPDNTLRPLQEQDSKVSPNGAKKESPYDHLPSQMKNGIEDVAANQADPNSPPSSPAGSDGKLSPTMAISDNVSTLDNPQLKRSSPTMQHRPEYAEHLKEGFSRGGSATVRGRRSPPTAAKPLRKANTLGQIRANGVGRQKRSSPPSIPKINEDDSLYNVPRPSSANDLYNVPKPVHNSPPSTRSNGIDTYDTPKASLQSNLDSHGSRVTNGVGDEGLYKVPNSVLAPESSSLDTYDSPRPQPASTEDVYNVPRPTTEGVKPSTEGLYNVPRQQDTVYSTPRPARSYSPTDPALKSPSRNNYESIDTNAPRTFHSSTLRPARSFESLHKFRVNDSRSNTLGGPISPPAFTRPKCEYVDIDLQEAKSLHPAKKAPLPPLPPTPTEPNRPVVDSFYAEISEADIAKNRARKISQGGVPSSNNPHALYNELPPARPAYRESASALEGLAKAKELNEEEGYELCLPAVEHLRRMPAEKVPFQRVSSADAAYPPVTQASALMEKYNINIHESTLRSRPFSESDILDDKPDDASVLGSSIPLDVDLQDEYVIVTGSDRRPKPKSYGMPQNVPVGGIEPIEEDQYETMSSAAARLNLSTVQSQYSTPNPSLGGDTNSSVPQPQADRPTTFARKPSPLTNVSQQEAAYKDESASAGIDLDAMSPADGNSEGLYTNFQPHQRQPSSLSTSSGHSGGVVGEEEEEAGPHLPLSEAVPLDHKASMVKIMEGSPLDRTSSTDLKSLTRSLGNVLDQGNDPTSPSSSAGDHTPPSSLTPPVPKKHNYVNCKPGEEDGGIRGRTVSAPKNKPPRPSPRGTLNRGDSTV